MKIALSADWHIGRSIEHDAPQLMALVDRCIKDGVDVLMVAGDICDRPNACTPRHSTGAVQAIIADAVAKLSNADVQTIMVPGNHDKAGAGSEDCLRFLDVLRPDVIVVREPRWIEHSGVLSLCLPWVYGADAEAVIHDLCENAPEEWIDARTILLAHVQVIGARMAGLRCCEGGSWSVTREFLEGLPFSRYALGDFHARQDLFDGRGGYIGALRQGNYGEEGNPQGFELWDSDTDEAQWIDLYAAPMHETYRPGCPAELDAIASQPSINFRRAVVSGWTPSAEAVERAMAAGVRVDVEAVRVERERRADDVAAGILDDPHALIRLWAGQQRPPVEGTYLDRILKLHDEATAEEKVREVSVVEQVATAV